MIGARSGNGRAFGYARVSTIAQGESGLGLAAQETAIRSTATRLGLRLVDVYTDAGLSGGLGVEDRPALADVLANLKRGDTLIVARRDRLSRDTLHALVIERTIDKRGARIVSAAGEGTNAEPDDPNAAMLRRIADAVSEYERKVIGLRTRAALRAKRHRNERAGNLPYGFRTNGDGRTLHAYEPEQQILRAIQDCRTAGYSLRQTADELNRMGHVTRTGSRWRPQYVASILDTLTRQSPPCIHSGD